MNTEPAGKPAKPSAESRVWAALANGAGVMFGLGIIVATFGWAESREQRPYAAYQSLQALGYQTLGHTVWLLVYLSAILILALPLVPLFRSQQGGAGLFLFWKFFSCFFLFAMLAFYFLLPLVAALLSGLGRNFRYPILGQRLEKYLRYDPLAGSESSVDEERADRWVAAMSQFGVILPLWRLGAPVVALATQGNRAPFLRFQSWQAIIYHPLGFVLYFGTAATYFLSLLPLVFGAGPSSGSRGELEQVSRRAPGYLASTPCSVARQGLPCSSRYTTSLASGRAYEYCWARITAIRCWGGWSQDGRIIPLQSNQLQPWRSKYEDSHRDGYGRHLWGRQLGSGHARTL